MGNTLLLHKFAASTSLETQIFSISLCTFQRCLYRDRAIKEAILFNLAVGLSALDKAVDKDIRQSYTLDKDIR